jgi:sugar-specific transcriptional regulator TrmB
MCRPIPPKDARERKAQELEEEIKHLEGVLSTYSAWSPQRSKRQAEMEGELMVMESIVRFLRFE